MFYRKCEDDSMIYLDNAATTLQKPQAVYDAVYDAMKTLGNSGRGFSGAALGASRMIYEARQTLCDFSEAVIHRGWFLRPMQRKL